MRCDICETAVTTNTFACIFPEQYNASTLQRVHQLERSSSTSSSSSSSSPLSDEHPLVDYTPPALVTLLFTDLGILTPSAVSDELIKLYL